MFKDADGRPIYLRVSEARFAATEQLLQELELDHGTLHSPNTGAILLGRLESHVAINAPVEGGDELAYRGARLVD